MSLKDYWYIVAESSHVGKQPVSVSAMGEHIVLFRNTDGKLAALQDRCSHRNMALSRGEVSAGCVICPYHGWKFDAAGRCVHIPSLGSSGRPPSHGVRAYPVREYDGYVWFYPGESIPEASPFRFPFYGQQGWTSFRMKTRFLASVEACLENFLDCPHTVYVHQGWFRNHDTRELSATIRSTQESVEVEFQGEPITKSLVSRLFFPKGKNLHHTDRFFMPNVSRVDYDFGPGRHFIITSQCTPLQENETEVYTVITYSFGRIGPLVRLLLEPVCRKIIRQDVDVLAVQNNQIRRFGGAHFCHVETDLLGLKIQSMRKRAEHSQFPSEAAPDREITICF